MLTTNFKTSALLLIALFLVTSAFSQMTSSGVEANDTARFLAGMPLSPDSPLAELENDPAWQQHAKYFDASWANLNTNQLSKIRTWAATYMPEPAVSKVPVFYMFSGPDYLYVDAFFPNGSAYVLCGIEPAGSIPDVTKVRIPTLGSELRNLETSLNSVLNFSFFITKDMKNDLQHHDLAGTLPLIYIFLARSNKTIQEVNYVTLDKEGMPQVSTNVTSGGRNTTPGVKIRFSQPSSTEPQTLYYFSTDISDDGIKKSGFLKFCQSLGAGNSFVKSASYLMHESYFSTIRSFLLNNSLALVQDDSGIPISFLAAEKWRVRYFGSYPGPISIFKKYLQPDLYSTYHTINVLPLDFGIGYRHYAKESTLMLGIRKQEPASLRPPVPMAGVPPIEPKAETLSSTGANSGTSAPTIPATPPSGM